MLKFINLVKRPCGNRAIVFLVSFFLVVGCFSEKETVPAVDTIFTGHFITLDPAQPVVEALAVSNGKIVSLGSKESLKQFMGEGVRVIEIPGVATPGIIDPHVHVSEFGGELEQLNLRGKNIPEIRALIKAKVAQTKPGEWIYGGGWEQSHFASGVFPYASDIDSVSPDNPVMFMRIGGHSAWVNSKALELAGINAQSEDPFGGTIVRTESNEPSGMLLEAAVELINEIKPDTNTPEQLERRIRIAVNEYARMGLTGVHDAGVSLEKVGIYKKLLAENALPVRVNIMLNGYEQGLVEHYLAKGPEIEFGNGMLNIRTFKIFVDGGLGARGAELSAPYADAPHTHGLRQMEDEELDELVKAAKDKGFQVAAHAIGDLAVQRTFDAYERAGVKAGERYRMEHASMVSPKDINRFVELGVIASMQPMFMSEYGRWGKDRVGLERESWILPIKDIVATGAILASSTDYPAADTGDPRATLYTLVSRKNLDREPENGWYPEQIIDRETALRSMTQGAAYASFQENTLGKLASGYYADFTVFEHNPLEVEVENIPSLGVQMTVVAGEITYQNKD